MINDLEAADWRWEEFLGLIAHELRKFLTPQLHAIQVLRLAHGDPSLNRKAEDVLERQLRKMAHFIDELLDFSRIGRGKVSLRKEHLEMMSVLTEVVQADRQRIDGAGLTLMVEQSAEPLYVEADRTLLAHVLSNVLIDAVESTAPEGHISITAGRQGDEAFVRVHHTTAGRSDDAPAQVLDLFDQQGSSDDTVEHGLRIGLAVAKGLIELHGGHIHADHDGSGQGNHVTVRLPLRRP